MILVSAARSAALTVGDQQNNPIVSGLNDAYELSPTIITSIGTELQDAESAVSGNTYDPWIATPSAGVVAWRADFGAPVSLSFAAIAAHNLSDVGARLELQHSPDGIGWTDCGCGEAAPQDNSSIAFRFAPVSARYWRLRMSNVSGDVYVSVIWLGTEIVIPQRLYASYTPPLTPTNVERVVNASEGGEAMAVSVVRRGSSASAQLSHLKPSFLRSEDWKAFQSYANDGGRFFWAWRPQKYGDVHYAWLAGSAVIAPTNTGPRDLMSFELRMTMYDDP